MEPKYSRVLLKLSGETLRGDQPSGLDAEALDRIAMRVKGVTETGVQVALVIGGGNFYRGLSASRKGMDRATGDYIGMLATVMNALALQHALESVGVDTRVQTAIEMREVAEPYIRRRAIRHLEKQRVVIFAAGTGSPFFTTDTTAALRANEIDAQAVLKATKVDGVYSADPVKDPTAERYDRISYRDAISRRLGVMDSTAFSLCMDNDIPIIVFDFWAENSIKRVIGGDLSVGTLVCADG